MPDVPPPPPYGPPSGPPTGPPPSGPPSGYPSYPGYPPQQGYPQYPGYPPQQGYPTPPTQPGHPGGPPPSGPPQWGVPSPSPKKGRKGLVIGLVVAAVLLLGAGVGGVVVLQGGDDDDTTSATDGPTDEPTDEATESTEPTETPSETPSETPTDEPTDEPTDGGDAPGTAPFGSGDVPTEEPDTGPGPAVKGGLKAREFANDWDFRIGDVELSAKYQSGVDWETCAPAERNGGLTELGCLRAVEWTYRALKGDLALSHLVLEMKSPAAASRSIEREQITESRWKLRDDSLLPDAPGVYKAQATGQYVVLTVVTYNPPAKAKQAEKYLGYANADIAGALAFRF